jgi:uncharacterized membrane protein
MVVNHFPIIGTIFGLGILVTGMIVKNNTLKNTAFVLFAIAAIFAAFSMGTGEGAEEMVEDMPSVGKQIIHEHEEIAEKFAIIMYATGFFGLLSLFASYKKHKLANIASYVTLVLALVAGVLTKNVGTTGGEIRHTEIRTNFIPTAGAEQNVSDGQNEKDED